MKNPTTPHPRRGFTLIELLVVITIIMILAAAGFAVATGAMNKARKLTAQNTATALDQAINMFYSEYGGFPVTGNANRVTTEGADGQELLNALLGNDPNLNPRGLSVLTAKEGKIDGAGGSDGLVYDASNNVRGLYDPWGNPFTVEMDTEFNEYLEFTPEGITGAPEIRLNGRRVAVYSPGVLSGETANQSTMVKTW